MEIVWHDAHKELPRKDGERYLVLSKFEYSGKIHFSHKIGYFAKNLYKADRDNFYNKKGVSGWYAYDSELGNYELNNIIYWMELPPPPGEEKIEPEIPQQFVEVSELLRNNPSVAKGLANFFMEFSDEKN